MTPTRPGLHTFAVVVFGDGTLPEMLLSCMQFRLVADLAAAEHCKPFHLTQLNRHIEHGGCRSCRSYLVGRMMEVSGRLAWVDRLAG